ncbi:hypothetical protein BSIN_3882 [Burkholderia singularis]|uniref:Uncharacterized protein n=1 Tax=Burkholderia singularis TaxID=1503053 RepID=A0A238H666_9BURK|nr:hypothetical protein BSIN_3882 [Burkholderia singularis]
MSAQKKNDRSFYSIARRTANADQTLCSRGYRGTSLKKIVSRRLSEGGRATGKRHG